VPALLPPPAPFKIFVLLAGVAEISVTRFSAALLVGRGIRYFGEGFLAIRYGDRAIEYIQANAAQVSMALVVLMLAALAGFMLWQKAQGSPGR